MEKRPYFSVIIPIHNAESYLHNAIASVLAQSCEDFEILAVDDASTDRSRELVLELAREDGRVHIVMLNRNVGAGEARKPIGGTSMTTVYEFELPKGYVDSTGNVHKRGKMRLATAGDEIGATRDPRVLSNPSYLTIVILSKVITELEGVEMIAPTIIERLFTADLAFLQDMYQRINNIEPPTMQVVCPDCGKIHEVPINFTREG